MTIPNIITIIRFCLAPIAVWSIVSHEWLLAFWTFAAAGISDGVDGFIAKRFNMRSELGAILDPLADKALLVSIFLTLGFVGAVPAWLVILVVFRDVMIIGAVLVSWFMGNPIAIAPNLISKANTAAQIIYVISILLMRGTELPLALLVEAGAVVVAVLTAGSALTYLRAWFSHMAG